MKMESMYYGLLCLALISQTASGQTSAVPDSADGVSLQDFVAEVKDGNPELRFYESKILAAKGGRRQAGIYANPELATQVGHKRVSAGGLSDEGIAWSVSVMQTFEYPGRNSLRKSIANQDIRLAELGMKQFRAALNAQANIVGFRLLTTQRRAEAATEVAERLRELSEVLVQRDPAGITPLIEIRIVEAAVVAFRKRAIEASQELQSAFFDANLLRGRPLGTPLKLESTPVGLPQPPTTDTFVSYALHNNFELQMRQVELEQQGLKVELSQNRRWPAISVGPYISQENAADRETIAGIGISLPLPIWNRSRGATEVETSREIQAETSLYLAQLDVERSVMEHSLAYQLRLKELVHWGDDALESFREAAELGDRHYRLGSLPISTYMELQREYLDAVNAIVELQEEAVVAREQLVVETGLPTSEWSVKEGKQ